MPSEDLDAVDRRILAALQADGRLSNVDLAEKVGLSPSPCPLALPTCWLPACFPTAASSPGCTVPPPLADWPLCPFPPLPPPPCLAGARLATLEQDMHSAWCRRCRTFGCRVHKGKWVEWGGSAGPCSAACVGGVGWGGGGGGSSRGDTACPTDRGLLTALIV